MTKEDLSIVSDMIRKNDNCCDLLFSSEWPQGILHCSSLDGVTSSLAGSASLSKLIKTTPSRYHFCTALKTFVEREPFESPFVSFARFINLAPLGSGHKVKIPNLLLYVYDFIRTITHSRLFPCLILILPRLPPSVL